MNNHSKSDSRPLSPRQRWTWVVVFAIAMAWMEAAVVYYLRTLGHRLDPHQTDALPSIPGLAEVEAIREAATLIMLWIVGLVAGENSRSRWGYGAIAFGVWDIFYYVFLRVICHWPGSLLEWDLLFLLPLPWWGPVLAPVLIAILMIAWGTLATQGGPFPHAFRAEWRAWLANGAGILLALYVFMEESLHPRGPEKLHHGLPPTFPFNWPLFIVALLLLATPVITTGHRVLRRARLNSSALTAAQPT